MPATASCGSRLVILATVALGSCLLVVGCGGATRDHVPRLVLTPGERVVAPQERDPLGQAVGVAFLDPETEVAVDVIRGKLFMPTSELTPKYGEEEGLIGLEDPQLHHQIFAYSNGGIPGRQAWNRHLGRAAVPAPGQVPVWIPPRLVVKAGRPIRVVLADGRTVTVGADAGGRVTEVRWPSPWGPLLTTTISYGSRQTALRGPTGVLRVYHYDQHRLITEVDAPGAAAHARRDAADGLLDSAATAKRIASRMPYGSPPRAAVFHVAPEAIGADFLDWLSSDGYQHDGVNSLAAMRVVDESLRRSGVLDIAEAIPVLDTYGQLDSATEGRMERLFRLLKSCHITIGRRDRDSVQVSISRTITPTEVAALDRVLSKMPVWVYIYSGARSLCARAD